MKKKEFLELLDSLTQAVRDNFLSPDDFMARINELYQERSIN